MAPANSERVRVVVLTGAETRHQYFRKVLADDRDIDVLATYCEGAEKGLGARVAADSEASILLRRHVEARTQAEHDFFHHAVAAIEDRSNPVDIAKGRINDPDIIRDIIDRAPDLLVCYGASLIKGELLQRFQGRFLNVHLGLSPYYRGSGTNVWPLINREPEYVGATFMYIDEGIDTGDVIHQVRARVVMGDGPHAIGNRVISQMSDCYREIIKRFSRLEKMPQPAKSEGRLYYNRDFTNEACAALYRNFREGLVEDYLDNLEERHARAPIIENPAIMGDAS